MLALACHLLPCLTSAHAAASSPEGTKLSLRFERGRLSAEIENAPLASVLAALERETGTAAQYVEPTASALPIWATFKDLSLEEGTRWLLGDASYLYCVSGSTRVVYVLSSKATRQLPVQPGGSAQLASFATLSAPQIGDATQAAAALGRDIQKAAARLESSDAMTKLQAVNQLSGTRDERAVDALAHAAMAAGEPDVRVMAASALAQSALAAPANETNSLNVLRQLLDDRDPNVRAVARDTLHDIEQQRREIARVDETQRQAGSQDDTPDT